MRQIVRQALEKRIIDEGAEHAKLQLARLQPAMRLAGEAIAEGDVTAIAPLMKVLDRLDRYQRVAKAVQVYDDEARKKLMDKINRVAANLGVDEPSAAERRAASASGGEARRRAPERLGRLKKKPGQGSAQAFEKARFGQGNQELEKSKAFCVNFEDFLRIFHANQRISKRCAWVSNDRSGMGQPRPPSRRAARRRSSP